MKQIHIYQYGIYKKGTGNGVNEFLYRITEALKDEFCVHFVNFDLEDANVVQENQLENNVRLHVFGRVKYLGLKFPQRFIDWLDTLPPHSVFHLHSVFRLANFALARILHSKNIPYIFTPHDSYSPESIQKKWVLKKILLNTTEKYILDNAQLVHAVTRIGEGHIQKYTHQKITTVHNFTCEDALTESKSLNYSICFLGRFDWYQKGIDIQVKVYRKFIEKNKKNIPFILMGAYKSKELSQVSKFIKESKLKEGKDILILGFLDESEKWKVLRSSYVYFQLSRFEGFSYSVVEALSIGKPVVISSHIPISDFVVNYKAGFVVDSIQESIEALDYIFQLDQKDYEAMCQNARRCYEDNFREEVVRPYLINMYTSIFADKIQNENLL